MSTKHPVIAVTGSSGAGTTTVKTAFEHICRRLNVTPSTVEGDSFHRYDRAAMGKVIKDAASQGRSISHFGPEANLICASTNGRAGRLRIGQTWTPVPTCSCMKACMAPW
jgi:phosphoribulokinase